MPLSPTGVTGVCSVSTSQTANSVGKCWSMRSRNTVPTWYGVVSNAGIARDAAFPALSDDDWDAVIHTNLDSFYNVIQPCIMPMIGARRGGRIITLSSVSGVMGNRGRGELQRSQSRNYRRNKSTGYRTRKAQNHRQLHRAGAY